MIATVTQVGPRLGIAPTCAALGLPRATYYRRRRPQSVPPPPRLQVYAARHWKDFQAAERARLSTYGWMDRSAGVVHVPIDRAMDLIAVRGLGPLPAAPVAMPAPATPAAKVAKK